MSSPSLATISNSLNCEQRGFDIFDKEVAKQSGPVDIAQPNDLFKQRKQTYSFQVVKYLLGNLGFQAQRETNKQYLSHAEKPATPGSLHDLFALGLKKAGLQSQHQPRTRSLSQENFFVKENNQPESSSSMEHILEEMKNNDPNQDRRDRFSSTQSRSSIEGSLSDGDDLLNEHRNTYAEYIGLLNSCVTGVDIQKSQSLLVQNEYQHIDGEHSIITQIPCFISADQTTCYVFINSLSSRHFKKSTLMNIVDTAEQVSPACQKLTFVLRRDHVDYMDFKDLLAVIDATRQTSSQIKSISKEETFEATVKTYGFFDLEI